MIAYYYHNKKNSMALKDKDIEDVNQQAKDALADVKKAAKNAWVDTKAAIEKKGNEIEAEKEKL